MERNRSSSRHLALEQLGFRLAAELASVGAAARGERTERDEFEGRFGSDAFAEQLVDYDVKLSWR